MKLERQTLFPKEPAVAVMSQMRLPRFASLPELAAGMPQAGSLFARFFRTPFADVDDRVARLAAANRAEREARKVREDVMSAADKSRRF